MILSHLHAIKLTRTSSNDDSVKVKYDFIDNYNDDEFVIYVELLAVVLSCGLILVTDINFSVMTQIHSGLRSRGQK